MRVLSFLGVHFYKCCVLRTYKVVEKPKARRAESKGRYDSPLLADARYANNMIIAMPSIVARSRRRTDRRLWSSPGKDKTIGAAMATEGFILESSPHSSSSLTTSHPRIWARSDASMAFTHIDFFLFYHCFRLKCWGSCLNSALSIFMFCTLAVWWLFRFFISDGVATNLPGIVLSCRL